MTSLTSIDCAPHFPSVTVQPTSCFLKAMKTDCSNPLTAPIFLSTFCVSVKAQIRRKKTHSLKREEPKLFHPRKMKCVSVCPFTPTSKIFITIFFYLISEGHFRWTLNLNGCFKINFVWQSSPKLVQFGEHSLIQGTKGPQLRSFSSAALTHGGL